MRRLVWIRLAAAGCFAVGTFPALFAQEMLFRSETAVDSLLNPQMAPVQPLRFALTTAALGTIREEDEPQRRSFGFVNVGTETVVITRVSVGCRCLSAVWPKGGIAPGAKGTIELTYVPENHPGRIDQSAFVYLSAFGRKPVARLTLTGEVLPEAGPWARYPHAMGVLHLKQREVGFRDLEAGATASERILCGNGGDKPLRLSAELIPDFAVFRTEPEVIPPGGEADIVITVDAGKIPASHEGNITFPVIVKGLAGRPAERTLTVKINRKNKNITD